MWAMPIAHRRCTSVSAGVFEQSVQRPGGVLAVRRSAARTGSLCVGRCRRRSVVRGATAPASTSRTFHTNIEQLTAFDFSGGINPDTDPYGRFVGYLNGDGGRSRGIEIGGQIRPSSTLSLSTSYTFADSVTDRDVAVPGVFRSMGIARHTFSLTAVQQIGARLSLHGVLVATGERYGTLYAGFNPRAYAYPGFAR